MRLHYVKELLSSRHTLIAGGATCYALIFGLLIYGLVSYVGLGSLRQPQMTRQTVTATSQANPSSCAEFAGMGQKLCNAEAKVEAARAKLQQRVAERQQRPQRVVERLGRAQSRTPLGPALAAHPPAHSAEVFAPTDPLPTSLASRE